jgi:F-type H+-transporting ATPase subunit epsilon
MPLSVRLVAVEREIWSGEADSVIARTTEGELGILPGHAPLLGQLSDELGVVQIHRVGEPVLTAAVHGGFLSVSDQGVSILAEEAELSSEIDLSAARQELRDAEQALSGASEDDHERLMAEVARASVRVAAAERAEN